MVVISHAFGNQFVRQALAALNSADLLERFLTTVYWDSRWPINSLLPRAVRTELNRRAYPQINRRQVSVNPAREAGRLLSVKLGLSVASGALSTVAVSENLDAATARYVNRRMPSAVYAYDGMALETFKAAKRLGTVCFYELPHGYWRYDKELLQEEALFRPDYAGTVESYRNSAHFEQKDQELSLADHIIVPSSYVKRTLEKSPASAQVKHIVPYGTNESVATTRAPGRRQDKLRVLFVGGLTQRKGISYLFDAVNMTNGSVALTIIGRKVGRSSSLDTVLKQHRWIPSMPHEQILDEMTRHDVLVLPSISEAFGLVIGEALSRGLPVITTAATGGPELMRDGQDGFFVPIRSAEAIAQKLEALHRDRELLECMSASALKRARDFTWQRYRSLLINTLMQAMEH